VAGTKGHSGGHNRLTAAELLKRGTFKPSRHRALLATTPPLAFPSPSQPPPLPDVVANGLQAAGLSIVGFLWQHYQVSVGNQLLLHELGHAADRLHDIRAALAAADPDARPRWLRLERLAMMAYASLHRQLNLER
jgi:hypothetical protein